MPGSPVRFFLRHAVYFFVQGFNAVSRAVSRVLGQRYQLVLPFATYAPWLDDREFQALFERIKSDCLVNIYQCWELWTLTRQIASLPGDLLEVGVWRGGSSVIMAKAMQLSDSRSHLFCCDTFAGLVKTGGEDPHLRDGDLADSGPQFVHQKMAQAGVHEYTVLEGVFPDQTGESLQNQRFSLCHIDVDTRASAEGVFEWVWPRLLGGGVVIFQDYGFHRTPGIAALVDEIRGRPGMRVVHNLNGNALVFKVES